MGYVLDPSRSPRRETRRVANERLGDAIDRLDAVISGRDADLETAIHEVRKRCKETRGLARLIRPALGTDFGSFDRSVRAAANQLSAFRDAHALLATIDTVRTVVDDDALDAVRSHQATVAANASASIEAGDERIARARELLVDARRQSRSWSVRRTELRSGATDTYRAGRTAFRRAEKEPTDHRLHEWRKEVKYLWYQLRLLQDASPSVIGPIVEHLDDLAEALGEDHDLAVLVERLDTTPDAFGPPATVEQVRNVARALQSALRERAFRAGAVVYAERADAFGRRIGAYWRLAVDRGPERPVGGIATLAHDEEGTDADDSDEGAGDDSDGPEPYERERKFLLTDVPSELDLTDGVEMRQGYLTIGDLASVRIRDAGTCTLTVKVGRGAERVEFEWPIERSGFDIAWPFTEGRRVTKTRHRVHLEDHLLEIDVFGGELAGLRVVEIEFGSIDDLEAFRPPPWFGPELTDDPRYTNAALALDGLPVDVRWST
jgi:CYTH domain-containing protein/CHAD domain-containing protein